MFWLLMAEVERDEDSVKRRGEQLLLDVFMVEDEDVFEVEFACVSDYVMSAKYRTSMEESNPVAENL